MAVVFISPKKRQRVFFIGITAGLVLFLAFVSFGVFFSNSSGAPQVLVFNKPKVSIDLGVFDSKQFKDLQPVPQMEIQYSYKATDKNKQVQTGFISAVSEVEAKKILTGMGLDVSQITEAQIGRDNPFTPYYQQVVAPPTVKKTTTKTSK